LQKILSGKLSGKEYWDSLYEPRRSQGSRALSENGLKILLKKIIGPKALEYIHEYVIRSYADYFLWDVIYKKYLPKAGGLKVLEIGSAPGEALVRLKKEFGLVPYGLEYSRAGAELNKAAFISHNINPDNAIYGDFFSDDFHKKYRGYFDIVISHGFIEHFTEVKDVVEKHIDLLAEEGRLIISIPNFRGINYILAWFFHKWFLPMHNLNIMRKKAFSQIFDKKQLRFLFCGYYGVFNLGLFANKKNSYFSRAALKICYNLQLILNVIFRLSFKSGLAESGLFSPYLIFIGVKKIEK